MQPPKLTSEHALFLDFDGTLVEIAPTPDAVVVPDELEPVLARLHRVLGGAVAIITGRQLRDIDAYLQPLRLASSGSHGVERRLANGEDVPPDIAIRKAAAEIAKDVHAALGERPGLLYERKDWSAALHYRGAPDLEAECVAAMRRAVAGHSGWEVIEGKMIVEGRLKGATKATAVEEFMAEPPFAGRVPVFIGDDTTDEDGMRAAQAIGGFAVKVGQGESVARYRLADPAEVLKYLQI